MTAAGSRWTFLTNHGHVLLCIAAEPDLRVRDVADRVGVTERAAMRILADLVAGGYLERIRVGRRTNYRLSLDRPMRHPVESTHAVRVLVDALADAWATRSTP
jgi:predicted transcriptional regulator